MPRSGSRERCVGGNKFELVGVVFTLWYRIELGFFVAEAGGLVCLPVSLARRAVCSRFTLKRDSRRGDIHRACAAQDSQRDRRRVRAQAPGPHAVWLWGVGSSTVSAVSK